MLYVKKIAITQPAAEILECLIYIYINSEIFKFQCISNSALESSSRATFNLKALKSTCYLQII